MLLIQNKWQQPFRSYDWKQNYALKVDQIVFVNTILRIQIGEQNIQHEYVVNDQVKATLSIVSLICNPKHVDSDEVFMQCQKHFENKSKVVEIKVASTMTAHRWSRNWVQ